MPRPLAKRDAAECKTKRLSARDEGFFHESRFARKPGRNNDATLIFGNSAAEVLSDSGDDRVRDFRLWCVRRVDLEIRRRFIRWTPLF